MIPATFTKRSYSVDWTPFIINKQVTNAHIEQYTVKIDNK